MKKAVLEGGTWEKHVGLVHALVSRFIGRGAEREDLVQVGLMGLLRAVDGYDETLGFAFSTYACRVIEGEIRSYLRQGGAVKVSRGLRADAAALAAARKRLGEGTPFAALAQAAGLSVEAAVLALGSSERPESLSDLRAERLPAYTEDGFERVLDRAVVQEALSLLNRSDAALIRLRYLHGLSQEKTARLLSLTQSSVSRAEKRILNFLKQHLA